jgi:serine/threonine protein phosphatase 1
MSRTIVIGDIHGCLSAFDALLNALALSSDDSLITLGDYIDRGPNSKGVIERLIELQDSVNLVPLMGNHEEMMLAVLDRRMEPFGWLNHGGVDTMDSYGFSGDLSVIPEEHRVFLRNLKTFHETPSHFMVHANYDPTLPLANQPEDLLRWIKISELLPPPHVSGKRAILGHTHDRNGEIFNIPHLVCIDTYCYGGKWLTAIDVETDEIWQANRDGELVVVAQNIGSR